ncbi:hypothetical protein [Actinomadura harenae]|uniref:hypothetical protein n=1 Tax=Actinomadura harenae TaxID=2483351 RepID=UPI000EFC8759|nr:hypothetical protein [Actinomadura harenae]
MTDLDGLAGRALAGLKPQVQAHGFATEWSDDGLRVSVRPAGSSANVHPLGLITCGRRSDDGGRWWWFLEGAPLAEVDHPYEAITGLKGAFAARLDVEGA